MAACLTEVTPDLGKDVLRGVSRSFYLTLRMLPERMRNAASLGYLLARTSDTLADTAAVPLDVRLGVLSRFSAAVAGNQGLSPWAEAMTSQVNDVRELRLLEKTGELLAWLERLPDGEAVLVREVVEIITGGQKLDLERFAEADRQHPVALPDDEALDDYAWRVAGCVGAFWTKLGFLTLGETFSKTPESVLLERGVAYGKGLQLVNILRDVPADLAMGRCYLPVADVSDRDGLLRCHARWLERASAWVDEGFVYARALESRRLRASSVLPAMLARETLGMLRGVSWETMQRHVKVPRRRVYLLLLRALAGFDGSNC